MSSVYGYIVRLLETSLVWNLIVIVNDDVSEPQACERVYITDP